MSTPCLGLAQLTALVPLLSVKVEERQSNKGTAHWQWVCLSGGSVYAGTWGALIPLNRDVAAGLGVDLERADELAKACHRATHP